MPVSNLSTTSNTRVYIRQWQCTAQTRVYKILERGFSSVIYLRKRTGWISCRVFFEKINRIKDVYHKNSNNLEATFVKLSEKIHYFITEFIDI